MFKLLVIEDHALVREGLVRTLRQLGADVVIVEAPDCDVAGHLLQEAGEVALILLDLGLPGLDGLSYLSTLRRRYPEIPVVILSAFDDSSTVDQALKLGAIGFVPKTYSSDQLLGALREVMAGRRFSPDCMRISSVTVPRVTVNGKIDPSKIGLTERQSEVLRLMSRGKSNRDIAGLLGLSEGTVKVHLTAIFKALGVSSRTQALVAISRQGIRL